MTEDAFFRAMQEAPDDDDVRLVFADWLEERGDPRAEFLRVQLELEPLRHVYGEPRVDALRERESTLLHENLRRWLGPLAKRSNAEYCFEPSFRRGFLHAAGVRVATFFERGAELRKRGPLLRQVAFYDVRDNGAALAASPHLLGIPHIQFADWPTADDAAALAASPHLAEVERVTVWLGSSHSEAVCRALMDSGTLKKLRELRLLQLYGGLSATGEQGSPTANAQADALVARLNRGRRTCRAFVERPFDCLFPLRGHIGYGMYAGTLRDGRLGLVQLCGREEYILSVFDKDGNHLGDSRERFAKPLSRKPTHSYESVNTVEFLKALKKEIGFRPALIYVKEFICDHNLSELCVYRIDDVELVANPDQLPWYHADPRWFSAMLLHQWLERGDFVVYRNNNYFAGPDGVIHSS